MGLESCYIIRIYVPLVGEKSKIDPSRSVHVRKILEVMKEFSQVGQLGNYGSLYELAQGQEWFTPLPGAKPTIGNLGKQTGVNSVVLTTYVIGWNSIDLDKFVHAIAEAHPWEHPIIECIGPDGPRIWTP